MKNCDESPESMIWRETFLTMLGREMSLFESFEAANKAVSEYRAAMKSNN